MPNHLFETSTAYLLDFHSNRDYIVNTVMQFNPAMLDYVKAKYSSFLNSALEMVSIIIQYGGMAEVWPFVRIRFY